MEKWVIRNKKGEIEKLAARLGISNITAKLICNREVNTEEEIKEYLYPDFNSLHSPFSMKGMDKACEVIKAAIAGGEKLRIIGDYDADGVTATYVLNDGLKNLGADVDYRIPDRVKDGYGLNENLVREAAADGVSLIVTCDNGIRAAAEIALAYELGMKVVLTDHHDIPEDVPKAEVVLNPKYEPCQYPYTEICGAVVAYKLIEALNCKAGQDRNIDIFKKYCDIIAISTICDVVELKGENRAIVKLGLKKYRGQMEDCGPINTGIRALMDACDFGPAEMNTYKMGYVVGPCINASGRIETAYICESLLCETDYAKAARLAAEIVEINAERKKLTAEAVEEAADIAEAENASGNNVLVILLEKCHESIAGIVAGRIREKYEKPTIVLTHGMESLKGSARSIEAYNITAELDKCADLLLHYGGHAMAAGLSLDADRFEALKMRLNENCKLKAEDMEQKVYIDLTVPAHFITEKVCNEIDLLEPFGTGNETVTFAEKEAEILALSPLGKDGQHLRIKVRNSLGMDYELVSFNSRETFDQSVIDRYGAVVLTELYRRNPQNVKFSFIYYPEINEFRGSRTVQYKLKNYRL